MALLVVPAMLTSYRHIHFFGLTIMAVLVIVYLFLLYAYISFFCFLAGVGTQHLIYIILRDKCNLACSVLFS